MNTECFVVYVPRKHLGKIFTALSNNNGATKHSVIVMDIANSSLIEYFCYLLKIRNRYHSSINSTIYPNIA